MKNRKGITVILAVSAVLVWGTIAVQTVRWMQKDKDDMDTVSVAKPSVKANFPETYETEYMDPFLREITDKAIIPESAPSSHPAGTPATEACAPPPIVFKGLMNCSGTTVAIVMKGSESLMLGCGDHIEGFYIAGFSYDELVLEKNGTPYKLKIE